jgi:hypothetical protein
MLKPLGGFLEMGEQELSHQLQVPLFNMQVAEVAQEILLPLVLVAVAVAEILVGLLV